MKTKSFFVKCHKNTLRLLTLALCLTLVLPFSAQAQQIPGFSAISTNPYVVDDLPISVDADDAVKAREKAFEQALNTGYQVILERLYPDETVRAAIQTPDTQQLGRMLQDFTTRDEKVGAKQYSATFQLRFRPGRVQKYLQSAGQKPPASTAAAQPSLAPSTSASTTAPAPQPQKPADTSVSSASHGAPGLMPTTTMTTPVLILPYIQTNKGQILWSGANPLLQALTQMNTDAKYIAAHGDLDDQSLIQESKGVRAPATGFQSLMQKYSTDRMVFVIAVPDAMDPNTTASKMTLMFYGASMANPVPEYLDSTVTSVDAPTDHTQIFVTAARQIQSQLPTLASRVRIDAPEQEPRAQDIVTPEEGPTLPLAASSPAPSTDPAITSSEITPSTGSSSSITITAEPSPGMPLSVSSHQQNAQTILPAPPVTNTPIILARFDTMTEWNDIRTRIRSIPGVTGVRINKLKAQEAAIEIIHPTLDITTLRTALETRGLDLIVDPTSGNDILTRRKGTPTQQMAPTSATQPTPSTAITTQPTLYVSSEPRDHSSVTINTP